MAKNAAIAVMYITIRTCSWSNCPCKPAKYRTYRSEIPVFVKCYQAFAPKGAGGKTIKMWVHGSPDGETFFLSYCATLRNDAMV